MSHFETNGLKALYFQRVETPSAYNAFNTRGRPDVFNPHLLRPYRFDLVLLAADDMDGLHRLVEGDVLVLRRVEVLRGDVFEPNLLMPAL